MRSNVPGGLAERKPFVLRLAASTCWESIFVRPEKWLPFNSQAAHAPVPFPGASTLAR
jgi:hypothetical protein